MILDKEWQLADGTWAPTALGANISPNVMDTSPFGGVPTANTGRNLGEGESFWMLITVKTTVTSGGAATVTFNIRTDSATNGTTSPVDLAATAALPLASLTAGSQFKIRFPVATYKKYVMANAAIGTAVLTGGAFEVDVVKDIQNNSKYAGGFSIDV
jgi:hypothetical protein